MDDIFTHVMQQFAMGVVYRLGADLLQMARRNYI
jgi:hypothetical protein